MKSKELIAQYYKIYLDESSGGKVYGKSSEDLLHKIAPIVIAENPKTILDFGCGRSSLINYFWNDGKRQLFKYDPAIREYKIPPKGNYDLVISTDVLEHLLEESLEKTLRHIKTYSNKVIFTVSLVPARKKLPNGMNAHVTIKSSSFWKKKILNVFDKIDVIEEDKNQIFLKTF
jgi:2-polyprenyl-3-methyl-5-hydroxy-6-metoxy-1,4-benzoquinol methylase